jgi:hypothetical protein
MAKLVTGTNYCECCSCGLFFGGVTTFDMHRVPADKDEKGHYIEDWTRRRCLTEAEMADKGWHEDENGYWARLYSRAEQAA